ncbi:DUF4252 domain-containing protein [Winogradskyella endarachnes]|uniref:DUF4252 domain-containing protein n=1 Tax=Winogradskyella endarachnes TaxID=2681965 RepID=A0A6L6UBI4_9FLAO|nr:DUF4252 domain-containing protein [Winogradskyella endarachnes]MUU78267.1 DUF4252 domain-containing protein [Winogradskyella endarachnes]
MSKKLIIITALLLSPILTFGQGVFDKFEELEDVSSFVINQKMFRMLASIDIDLDDKEDQEFLEMAKKITGLKVFTTGDEKISTDMKLTVDKYLKSSQLEELMRFKDGGQTIKFYVKEGKDENHVKELLMFMTGLKELTDGQDIEINGKKRVFETLILSLTGDIDLRQISKITSKMDVPAGEHLNKAGENKE